MQKQGKYAKVAIIGETLQIVKAKNLKLEGLEGQAIDETKNTIKIRTKEGEKTIIKDQVTITIKKQTINGKKISGRIEERIKQ